MDEATKRQVFISYCHKDEGFKVQLEAHLSPLLMIGKAAAWNDRKMRPGQPLYDEIKGNIRAADIVLMLISSDYLASSSCQEEFRSALERARTNNVIAVPIIVRPCDWTILEFGELLAVPRDGTPVSKWHDPDEAWTNVVMSLRELIDDWHVKALPNFDNHVSAIDANLSAALSDEQTLAESPQATQGAQWVRRQEAADSDWDDFKTQISTTLNNIGEAEQDGDIKLFSRRWGGKVIIDVTRKSVVKNYRLLLDDIGGWPGYPGYQLEFYGRYGDLGEIYERVRWLATSEDIRMLMIVMPKTDKRFLAEAYANHLLDTIKSKLQ